MQDRPHRTVINAYVVNDLAVPIRAEQCGPSDCRSFEPKLVFKPGEKILVGVVDSGIANPLKVESVDGDVYGCVPLVFHKHLEGIAVRLRGAIVPCTL